MKNRRFFFCCWLCIFFYFLWSGQKRRSLSLSHYYIRFYIHTTHTLHRFRFGLLLITLYFYNLVFVIVIYDIFFSLSLKYYMSRYYQVWILKLRYNNKRNIIIKMAIIIKKNSSIQFYAMPHYINLLTLSNKFNRQRQRFTVLLFYLTRSFRLNEKYRIYV